MNSSSTEDPYNNFVLNEPLFQRFLLKFQNFLNTYIYIIGKCKSNWLYFIDVHLWLDEIYRNLHRQRFTERVNEAKYYIYVRQ